MLSKREKIIALMTALVLGLLVGDRYILTPLMNQLNQWETEKQDLTVDLNKAQNLLRQRKVMDRKWKAMAGEGLAADAESESRVLHALDRWSQDTGLTLTSVKPLRLNPIKDELHEMTFIVAGTGTLHATAEFIWQIERAQLPLRIRDMQLGSSNESGTEMSLQLNISALALIDQEAGGRDAS
jgi:Tfp pilus assembly protein PilO